METIKDWRGKLVNLSDEIYEIADNCTHHDNDPKYRAGAKVRLISGVDGNETPGYHFSKGWVTVCSVEQIPLDEAHFCGFPTECIKPFIEKPFQLVLK